MLVAISLCGLLAHDFMIKALTVAPATVVTPLEFLKLALISKFGLFLYIVSITWTIIFGGLKILFINNLNLLDASKF